MRRRLILLSLATTVLVVVAFVVPLALLVRRQAVESAQVAAERDAQSVAAVVALAAGGSDQPDAVAAAIGDLPPGTVVFLGGATIGTPAEGQGSLAEAAAETLSTVSGDVEGGWEIALPVVGPSEVAVVDSFVTSSQMAAGVAAAWALLAALALVLIGLAVWLADRLGRSLTSPIEDLARSAHRLAEGDLEARVEPSEPEEIRETGEAFNYLASRLDELLVEERESVADLSHRLRTPLTSLRLQAEALSDVRERAEMVGQVDRLEHAMNQVIEMTRSRAVQPPAMADLNEVVRERVEFWAILAAEQDRKMGTMLADGAGTVPVSRDDIGVVIDTLIGNVFAHTPAGTAFQLTTGADVDGVPWIEVSDEGGGFGDLEVARGVSAAGSTGLGLDIARKTARAVGGSVDVSDRPEGGAVVMVRFG